MLPRRQRPNVRQFATIVGSKSWRRLGCLELLPEIFADLNGCPEPSGAWRGNNSRCARPPVHEHSIDSAPREEWSTQIQAATSRAPFEYEQSLLGANCND